MHFQEIEPFLSARKELTPLHYSEALRLRPNYLLYTLGTEMHLEQKKFLLDKEIPWAAYPLTSPLLALVAFLRSVQGGAYIPSLEGDLIEISPLQCVYLLDPHLIADFEKSISKKRRGVLIRRPLLASLNFEKAINIEKL